ncbi:MAG: four helix bundle protein [Candidatus Gracilibacteria bacterium]|nr:four helix bundle protein [Candidatus Gracilibacteria bacterium]
MEKDILKTKSFAFAVRIVKFALLLQKEKKEFTLSQQILKSGTSIGANVAEAHAAISRADFSAKISIAHKETMYWLTLLKETDFLEENLFQSLFSDAEELAKITFSVLKTTRLKK